ncbi:MAG: metalloregulator ArsR/SmtB family transcription factor [Sphingomonas sp.]|jgi:DNA-binding transcriptional ArsR family regulator
MESKNAITALSALAHGGRLAVFRMLVQAGAEGVAAGEIARRLNIAPNTLSANLNILSHADLIESRRDGRSVIYSARFESMANLLDYLMEDCCGGNPQICARVADTARRSHCDETGQT